MKAETPRGRFVWHDLMTTDPDAAIRFYTKAMGTYHTFGRKGMALGGIYQTPRDRPIPPNWLPYARVEDVKIATERALATGGTVVQPPVEVPGGDWESIGLDPQGGAFAVHNLKGS